MQTRLDKANRQDKMPTHKSYHTSLIESLQDPAEAAAYLDAVLEDGEQEYILLALKNVAEARKNLVDTSDQTNSAWETCYQSLVKGEMPGFFLLCQLLNELGLKFSITAKEEAIAA